MKAPSRALSSDTPWDGMVTEDGRLILDFPKAFKAFYQRFAGHEIVVLLAKKSEAKTRLQEKGFHAMIAPWCRDEGHRLDDLKHDLLCEIFGTREVVSLVTGKVTLQPREPHTSKLTKDQYSELIERSLEIAAGCGYVLIAPEEYKQLHPEKYPEYARTRRKKAA